MFYLIFCHNWISGLAAAFKNCFFGGLPALSTFDAVGEAPGKASPPGELGPNLANIIIRLPPIPFQCCNDSPCIYSHLANCVMQSHRGNTIVHAPASPNFCLGGVATCKNPASHGARCHDIITFFHGR